MNETHIYAFLAGAIWVTIIERIVNGMFYKAAKRYLKNMGKK